MRSAAAFLRVQRVSYQVSQRVPRTKAMASSAASEYPFDVETQGGAQVDAAYPGTAVTRLATVLQNVKALDGLSGSWPEVRCLLLTAGGLKVDQSTSHGFNDDNHCDLTTMKGDVSSNSNADGAIAQISRRNFLGAHIQNASLPELGPGGSWTTCTNGAHLTPPNDVAHTQFRSRIAFKLVWVPPSFDAFVLVDDEGRELRRGRPTGALPSVSWRRSNYELVRGGKYARVADAIAAGENTMKSPVMEGSNEQLQGA